MKRKIAFVLLLLCLGISGFAQQNATEYDSLRQVLGTTTHDSTRVSVLSTLCRLYMFTRPDSSLYYGYQGLALSRKINDIKEEVQLLRNTSTAHFSLGNRAKALQLMLEAVRVADENNILNEKAVLLMILSSRHTKEFPKRLTYLKEAEKLLDSLHIPEFTAVARTYIADLYFGAHQLDSAISYAQAAHETAVPLNVGWVTYRVELTLGHIEQARGNYELAITHFRNAQSASGNTLGDFDTNFALAKFFEETNDVDSCIFYAQRSLDLAKSGRLYLRIVDASMLLASLYEKKDVNKAYAYGLTAIAAKDSVDRVNEIISVESLTKFDEQERQYELDIARTKYENQLRLNVFLGSTFTLLAIGFFLYRNSQQKHKAKQQIEKAYDQLKSTQSQLIHSEKMASLGELTAGIAHEIQNPLNFVNNFSEVNKELIDELRVAVSKNDPHEISNILNALADNEAKVIHHGQRADSIVKSMLMHSRASTSQRELTDINALCSEYLRLAYHGFRAKNKGFDSTVETHFDPTLPKISVIQQDIGKVLLNLINNAFYAVNLKREAQPSEYTPLVSVATRNTAGHVEITIRDNGNGIPESIKKKIFQPFFTTKPTGQGPGLGLSLSYDIVRAHAGDIVVDSEPGQGSTFKIILAS